MNLAFIGGGVMAEAILKGVLAAGLARSNDVRVGEPVPARRHYLSEGYRITAVDDNRSAAGDAQLVILAVKPQDLAQVFEQLKGALDPGASRPLHSGRRKGVHSFRGFRL